MKRKNSNLIKIQPKNVAKGSINDLYHSISLDGGFGYEKVTYNPEDFKITAQYIQNLKKKK